MTSYFNNSIPLFPNIITLQDEINQLQETSAVAGFIQEENHAIVFATSDIGPGSDHNLILNTPVIIDRDTGDVSNVKSLSFEGGQVSPPVPGSMWLNSGNNHIYHGFVDIEATGGDVTGPMSSVIGEIPVYGDIVGDFITNTGIIIDPLGNVGNFNSVSLDSNIADPVPGSIWLDSGNNHLMHGNVDLEATNGDVFGPASSTNNAVTLYNGTTGKLIKNSNLIVDASTNIFQANSILFNSNPIIPVAGSLWENNSDGHLYHGAVDLENTGGDVTGPISSINNNITVFDGASGKLIKDSGVPITDIVTGPLSAVNNNLASYNLNTGKIIKDSGILSTNVVQGPASAINNNLAAFDTITGKLIKDSGISSLGVGDVVGPASSLNNEVPVYSGTSGKILTNTGVLFSALGDVKGPASSLNSELAVYSGTTGKIITNSAFLLGNLGDVKGPASSMNNEIPVYSGVTGKLIANSGIISTSVGNVFGPLSSINNDIAVFDLSTGKIIKDSGILVTDVVRGPVSSISGDIPIYNGVTGKLISDSGILSSNIVQGPASAVSGNIAIYNGITGKLISDSGISSLGVGDVVGPASSVNDRLASYNGLTGKLIKDSGILSTDVVIGPASSIDNRLASYNGVTGKLIKDSGILTSNVGDVKGPVSAINNNLVAFDTTSGKLIKDSGISSIGLFSGIAVITDVKAANTDGGTFTSGAWRTRVLNTIQTNGTSGASIASNQLTLTAGTYRINGYAPARNVFNHQTRIQNITDATTAILGGCQFTQDASGVLGIGGGVATSNSDFDGLFTIASTKVFELQHQCSVSQNTNGFGVATNFGVNCVYSKVIVTKFA